MMCHIALALYLVLFTGANHMSTATSSNRAGISIAKVLESLQGVYGKSTFLPFFTTALQARLFHQYSMLDDDLSRPLNATGATLFIETFHAVLEEKATSLARNCQYRLYIEAVNIERTARKLLRQHFHIPRRAKLNRKTVSGINKPR